MHISVPIDNTIEIISTTKISPYVSHSYVKVCYVGQDANRNGTVITKELATEMGEFLPGSPVVGLYNAEKQDFEGHNRDLIIEDGKLKLIDMTKPYGFVPTNAKVWFQVFRDDGVEHEYLCTECYIWTGVYEESKRVIEKGNNQSMELEDTTGFWSNDNNSNKRIFIYNKALVQKLCILGENVEPCFEGAQFKTQFSLDFDEEFKAKFFALMENIQNDINKGGNLVFTTYAVEIGDTLWNAMWDSIVEKYPEGEYFSKYRIEGVYKQEEQKFAVLQDRSDSSLHRVNFTFDNDTFSMEEEMTPMDTPSEQFALEDVEKFETEYAESKKKTDEPEEKEPEGEESEEKEPEDDEKKKKPEGDHACGDGGEELKKKKEYNLDEISEYVELKVQYEELQGQYSTLEASIASLNEEIGTLKEFKAASERKEKQTMIDSFTMLTDEDKKDVIENIDTYSLDDIEAKLSVIYVRNNVDFNLGQEGSDPEGEGSPQGLFNLNNLDDSDSAPDWIKAVREVQAAIN